jgi:large subunit ribosomal protein L5
MANAATTESKKPRLREKYERDVVPMLMEKFSIKNRLAVPKVEKIVINMGIGKGKETKEYADEVAKHLAALSGQRPVVTRSRLSIAGFKLREGMKVGLKVTLRRDRMWEFLDRLISLAIPRLRDFRGLSRRAFDGRGNYSLGLSEQTVFPEVDIETVQNVQGMDVTLVTDSHDDARALAMLQALGMPFKGDDVKDTKEAKDAKRAKRVKEAAEAKEAK